MASATALEAMRGQIKNLHIKHQLIMLLLPYLISLHFEYDSKKNIENTKNYFCPQIFLPMIPNLAKKSMRLSESNFVAYLTLWSLREQRNDCVQILKLTSKCI